MVFLEAAIVGIVLIVSAQDARQLVGNPLAVFYGSSDVGPLGPPSDPLTVKPFVPEWGAILPEAEGYQVARPCSRRAPAAVTGVWRPDAALIGRVDQTLAPLVQGALERAPGPRKPTWSSAIYYRQYFGIVVNGRRVVYTNAFRVLGGRTPTSWELQFLRTCDGGYLFFGAEFDVETGRLQNLSFNG